MKVDLESLTETLETLRADWALLDQLPAEERARLLKAVAALHNPDRVARRQRLKEARRERKAAEIRSEEEVLHGTGIRTLRRKPVFTTPNVFPPEHAPAPAAAPHLSAGRRHCYVCKAKYEALHHFYDQLCPPCAALNWLKRTELADLRGRVALLTGGRVKIGYQAGIKLLRAGARVIVTTRFPRDSAARTQCHYLCDDRSSRSECRAVGGGPGHMNPRQAHRLVDNALQANRCFECSPHRHGSSKLSEHGRTHEGTPVLRQATSEWASRWLRDQSCRRRISLLRERG
jgi:hypothetical protein